MATNPNSDAMRKEIEATLKRMELDLALASPGVMEILKVYGGYQAAVDRMNAYYAAFRSVHPGTTTNATGGTGNS